MGYIVHIITVSMSDVETMSLVGYKIGYIVNFVPNPDRHLDSKWRSCNRPLVQFLDGKGLIKCSDEKGRVAIAIATSSRE